MKYQKELFVFLFLICLVSVSAQPNVFLTLKDVQTTQSIENVVVSVAIDDTIQTYFLSSSNVSSFELDPGTYSFEAKVDDQNTPGKDYYTKTSLRVEGSVVDTLYLYPVGSVRGVVTDQLENVVSNAALKFDCTGAEVAQFPSSTDEFGSFSIPYFPAGTCTVFGSFGESIGRDEIEVVKGRETVVSIELDTSLISEIEQNKPPIFLILLVLLVLFLVYKFRKRPKKEPKVENNFHMENNKDTPESTKKITLGKRAHDVIATLNEREKAVVDFIKNQGGKTTQSKIYYGTGLPKVSISRYIQSLEQKNIIEIKRLGKVNEISFSQWITQDSQVER